MTEDEWLTCDDPLAMLKVLRWKASNRKMRLLACGCCRLAESVLISQPLQRAIETAERYADSHARYGEMVQAAKAVEAFSWSARETQRIAADGVWHLITMGLWWNLSPVRRTKRTLRALLTAEQGTQTRLAQLVRCVC